MSHVDLLFGKFAKFSRFGIEHGSQEKSVYHLAIPEIYGMNRNMNFLWILLSALCVAALIIWHKGAESADMSDEEFVARLPRGTDIEEALELRALTAEYLNIPYLRVYPENLLCRC